MTVGIIVLIIAILLPMLVRARKTAMRTRMQMEIHLISQGLDAYKADFADYPRIDYSTNNPTLTVTETAPAQTPSDRLGAVLLCWALVAPGPATGSSTIGGDGADGPGFRIRGTQGQVYGPYIQADKFNISGTSDWDSTLNDPNGLPYLYFPAFQQADIHSAGGGGYVAAYAPSSNTTLAGIANARGVTVQTVRPFYNYLDNPIAFSSNQTITTFPLKDTTAYNMQSAMGDTANQGYISGSEIAATTAPYVLWGAGPDMQYGTSDDVTNFGQ